MTRNHKLAAALAKGVAVHTAITATGIAALAVWAQYCERHRHPGRAA